MSEGQYGEMLTKQKRPEAAIVEMPKPAPVRVRTDEAGGDFAQLLSNGRSSNFLDHMDQNNLIAQGSLLNQASSQAAPSKAVFQPSKVVEETNWGMEAPVKQIKKENKKPVE